MTNKNNDLPQKRRPGPKKGPKLDQLTVRLDPKIRFGLELMSRANHQSLGQSVEWAIRTAMRYVAIKSSGNLAVLLDEVWGAEDFELMYRVWSEEPNLLTFDERAIVRFVNMTPDLRIDPQDLDSSPDFEYINKYFPIIKTLAEDDARSGRMHGFPSVRTYIDYLEREHAKQQRAEKRKKAREIDEQQAAQKQQALIADSESANE